MPPCATAEKFEIWMTWMLKGEKDRIGQKEAKIHLTFGGHFETVDLEREEKREPEIAGL